MKKTKVYVVCEFVTSTMESPSCEIVLVTTDKEKAVKQVHKSAKKLAKEFGIDLNNYHKKVWEVDVNTESVYVTDTDYTEGFEVYIKEKYLN